VSLDVTFAPVRSQTAFEETMERIATAIKLGVLNPGDRLPAERELCARLGISRSTLRQALTALGQSGHLVAARGRGGGTFIAEQPPPLAPPSTELMATWREACDARLAVELGVAVLAARRADSEHLDDLAGLVGEMDAMLEDFDAYRHADVRFHIGLAETTGSHRVVVLATEAQAAMTDLISHIAHPPEVLANANDQHSRLIIAVRARDADRAASLMAEHLGGTEHVLAGLLPH
jgi:GntR family transcriptional repressor for pyruvate dehydrogenase complex